MSLMSVSQYAKHANMSRQAFYTWEARQGFPARVGNKIDQVACDAYLKQFRDSHDQRIDNAKSKSAVAKGNKRRKGNERVNMSVTEIKQHLAECVGQAASMDPFERAEVAAKAVGLYLSLGPDNPPITFGCYRLSMVECPEWESQIVAGGAFGLLADDVVSECRAHVLYVMDSEAEMYSVIPALLYVLAEDN
ncbi:hypothetical protein [Serratia fonticola]|uniref:hypothetical protein n=1 Tax=Serratia fonticola TaxID=47917 RepID=UPI00192D13C7|nr:hypothetical protein [Serratia fonticola]MBL5827647.1 hypothetical protein [Serratia fonticola]